MNLDKLQKIFKLKARFIDITVQHSSINAVLLKDGIAKDISSGEIVGIGIRVLDKTWGFASANNLEGAYAMAQRACKIAKHGKRRIEFQPQEAVEVKVRVAPGRDPAKVEIAEKLEMLHTAEKKTKISSEIASTSLSYADAKVRNWYLSSEGSRIESETTRVALYVSAYAKSNGKMQVGLERLGATGGFEAMEGAEEKARLAAEKAVRLLSAEAAPSGNFKVVLDPQLTGVFIHEALGHAIEADHVIQGESILEGKLGESVASELVTVYDDPTLEGSFGFYFYDSEGTKARKKAVFKNGALVEYLHSRETSNELKQKNTGNARAQAYNYQPIVRMSNTYLEPKDWDFEDIIEDIELGVYLKGSKGGEVDTARGVFQFSAEEGFLIERGKITKPVRDVALSGETLSILKAVDAVGKDFDLHIGFCGKAGQLVPVGDGGATIRTFATVGGTR